MSGDMCDVHAINPEKVARAKAALVSDETAVRLSDAFKVLGDPTRIKIIFALLGEELCVCDIAATLQMSQSAVSHQLGSLRRERLVKRRKAGRSVFYSLDDVHIERLLSQCLEHVTENRGAFRESGANAI